MKDKKITIKNHKLSLLQIVRNAVQLVSFILIPGLFITVFYSFKDIWTSVIGGTFVFSEQISNILIVAAALLITFIWGRVFCGFFCSFGLLQDLLWLGGKHIPFHPQISEKTERGLKLIKYFVLAFVVLGVWTFALPGDSVWSPWTVFGAFTSFSSLPAKEIVLSVGGLLLLVTVIGSLLIERFFCKYFCPLGAVFSLVSRFRLFGVKKKTVGCGNCRFCTKKCAMALPLYKYDKVSSGECINCLKCVSACPRNNAAVEAAPAVTGTVAAAALAGMIFVGPIPEPAITESEKAQIVQTFETETNVTEATGKYADGVYNGTGQGYKGNVSVTVTVEGGQITDITVKSHRDDSQYFSKAKSGVIARIISSQGTDVSTVSGATFSSRGIIEAVKNALSFGAYTDNDTEQTTGTESETEPVKDHTAEETTDDTTGNKEKAGAFADGVYTGTGTGLRGTTAVSVTVSGGKIIDITVTSYKDDRQYFTRAQSGVINAILSSQSINVSTVSGATFSSNSIIEAVANALDLEFTNPNSSMSGGHGGRH
jgi:uncharacterized protein with FMN-binding domain